MLLVDTSRHPNMNPQELTRIVALLAQNFTDEQRFELIGRVSGAMMMAQGSTPVPPVKTVLEKISHEKAVSGETAPVPRGNVMIPEGLVCECDQCNKPVYRIVANVHENMAKKEFVACFQPLGDAPELKMPLDTWADSSGNLAIDCPLCKGTKSLWIKGKGDIPFNDVPEVNQ